ncbi:serine/threonine-protein kinase [Nonomuraea harbinensis]|uniref:Serine/threonine-protein kinase n=1 Tax=Nonomuraea harbinensis TaxID=1286938 RepID=A0ABW1BR37_9ACTN|nr:serine/threonine-protein kinase [Nonomuraea harbinensis]
MPQISPLVAGDPTQLGSFRLTGRIGEGGQGIVFLGVDQHGERAAVKLLHVKFTGDKSARSRFARELKAAKRVASFCTARVMEADLDGDTPYIASEYIDGRALREIVETDGPLTGTVLDRLAIGTATALTAIHHASIIHRDLKPDNVLIAADGPRVVDFGIARIIDSTGTITSRAIGTPAYMAPEQIAGEEIGPFTDVFAWGATIAFAATGVAVFEGNSIATVLNRILTHEVDVGMMPEPLRGVVRGALSKSAADRPSADQILLRLLGQPETVGASTALLTRGVQVAGDDTTPFSRVSVPAPGTASAVTGFPAVSGRTGAQDPPGHAAAGAVQGHDSSGTGAYGTPGGTGTYGPAQGTGAHGTQGSTGAQGLPAHGGTGAQGAGVPTREAGGGQAPAPPRKRGRAKWWVAFAAALAVVATIAAMTVVKGWPLNALGPDPGSTEDPLPPSYASVAEKVAATGKIVIGVKADLPGVGLRRGDAFEGFDVDVARRVAEGLGARDVEFVAVSPATRVRALAEGSVDLVVATYSIVDDPEVAFAGPYYLAHRDVLVHRGPIDSLGDLKGKKICAVNSPSVGAVQDKVKVHPVPAGNYAECMNMLLDGTVDAVPGDDLILAGFAGRENVRFRLLGAGLSDERYGVGLRKGDARTCKAISGVLADLYRKGAVKELLAKHFGNVEFEPETKVPAMEACE